MNSANKKVYFGDLVFEICKNVYEPAEDSFLFAGTLNIKSGSRVLDMGTGSGILGILAAKEASEVVAIDVNPYAIRCAKENAKRNNVYDKIAFLQGDLCAPLKGTAKFDLILFNAPYLPSEQGEDATWLGRAWAGGTTGRQVIDRFLSQVPAQLECDGKIFLLQSTLSDVDKTMLKFTELQMPANVVAECSLPFFEKLVLLKATPAHCSKGIPS
jgi:release factor glutamine methyltransferase